MTLSHSTKLCIFDSHGLKREICTFYYPDEINLMDTMVLHVWSQIDFSPLYDIAWSFIFPFHHFEALELRKLPTNCSN